MRGKTFADKQHARPLGSESREEFCSVIASFSPSYLVAGPTTAMSRQAVKVMMTVVFDGPRIRGLTALSAPLDLDPDQMKARFFKALPQNTYVVYRSCIVLVGGFPMPTLPAWNACGVPD